MPNSPSPSSPSIDSAHALKRELIIMLERAHPLVCGYPLSSESTSYEVITEQLRAFIEDIKSLSVLESFDDALRSALTSLGEEMDAAYLVLSSGESSERRREAHRALQTRYEECRRALSAHIGMSVGLPARVMNWRRSIFHLTWGLISVYLAERHFDILGLWRVALGFMVVVWTIEAARNLPARWVGVRGRAFFDRMFAPIMHAQEVENISSGTWYVTSVFILASLCSEMVLVLAVLTLAVGDPVAGLIGRRFGKHKLTHNRSVEGSLAFVVSATLSAYLLLVGAHPEISAPWILALSVGVGGAIGELVSGARLDDNFTVPIGAALGATFSSMISGVYWS